MTRTDPPASSVAADGSVPAVRHADTLPDLLGGRGGALDAAIPAVAFATGWLVGGYSVPIGTAAALLAAVAVAGWRLYRGRRLIGTLLGLLGVCVATIIALRTGRAEDYFLVRLVTNAASALVWAASILLRWPLLGVVVGIVLGQRTRWRSDPALLRAYGRASWIWVGQYLVRLAVFIPLWSAGQVVLLATAQLALTWPLVAACVAVSWWVLRRSLPPDHAGLRHPADSSAAAAAAATRTPTPG